MTNIRFDIGVGIVAFILSLLSIGAILIVGKSTDSDCGQQLENSALSSAQIHYLNWSVLTRTAYDLDRTRSLPPITISDEARLACLMSAISEKDMLRPIESAGRMNGRFLLVGTKRDGSTMEIYADQFHICSLDQALCRKNDELSRSRISFILESTL